MGGSAAGLRVDGTAGHRRTLCVDLPTSQKIARLFWSGYADERETIETIARIYRHYQYLVDPHGGRS